MKIIIITVLINVFLVNLPSQQKILVPVDYRFKGGHTGFETFFRQNLKLSDTICCFVGNSISRVEISPDGKILKADIINPLDSVTDTEILSTIIRSEQFWKKCDTVFQNQVLYFQIAVSSSKFIPLVYHPVSLEMKRLFVEPLVITRYDTKHEYDFPLIMNEPLTDSLNGFLAKDLFENALPLLNELIRRAPFNRELYKTRIRINYMLENSKLVLKDNDKLMDFAEGYSLDEILRDMGKDEL